MDAATRPIFQTARLCVLPLVPDDIESLHELQSSAAVMRYCGGVPMSYQETSEQLQRILRSTREGDPNYRVWKIISLASGEFIGNCALLGHAPDVDELGYRIRESFWRQRIGSEVASALLEIWMRSSNKAELRGCVYTENVASWRILERLGFQLRREFVSEQGQLDREYFFERSRIDSSYVTERE